jgi:signal transduction histidine kinase
MNSFFHTWSFRVTALFGAMFAISPAILFAVTYYSALRYASEDYHEEIETEFNIILDEAQKSNYRDLSVIVENHLRLHDERPTVYLLEDGAANKLSGNIAAIPVRVGPVQVPFPGRSEPLDSYMFRMPNGDYLLIGEVSEKLDILKNSIVITFVVGGAISIAVGILLGLWASATLLSRLRTIGTAARAIATGDMRARVPVAGGVRDEFDDLGQSINLMLERIEELMHRVRQISSDIAHDLRAPLSLLKQNIERAQSGGCPPQVCEGVLEHAGDQVDTILSLFESLLKIGEIEAGHVNANASVNLSALLSTLADDFSPVVEDRGQTLTAQIEPDVEIVGEDRLLLQLAINLIENAIHHTPRGTKIRIAMKRVQEGIVIEVDDNGPGVPASELHKITRPFYRIGSQREIAGNGLGLSLVSAIADYHGAILSFRSTDEGFLASVLFPTPDSTAPDRLRLRLDGEMLGGERRPV